MNDAQTWTLIAGFLGVMVTFAAMTRRVVKAEIAVLRNDIQHLDRDVQAVMRRLKDG